jgi:hypothetical protein
MQIEEVEEVEGVEGVEGVEEVEEVLNEVAVSGEAGTDFRCREWRRNGEPVLALLIVRCILIRTYHRDDQSSDGAEESPDDFEGFQDEESVVVSSESEEEEEEQAKEQPYNALLQLLGSNSGPARKKRKLYHKTDEAKDEEKAEEVSEEVQEPQEVDVLENREASGEEDEGDDAGAGEMEDEDEDGEKKIFILLDWKRYLTPASNRSF